MTSLDTNILLPAIDVKNSDHTGAAAFLDSLSGRTDVVISEFVLLELYNLLRNAAVVLKPLAAAAAVDVCETFRHHPCWQVVGFPPDSLSFHDTFWPKLRDKHFARRRSYDLRLALSLQRQGITDFATVNVKDFEGLGFRRVWNPLK